ncbi:guanylate kinase [Haloimpatiens lingqiaonensis]|uniref:guanylate kinase n=1 Tax=Haloimpatiens lingqiaonensis TaxID=1380675 RepID=UPI0010FD3CAD|nr:guanylate kinase [Haloimpatiens lingqiaonensis]
MDSKGLLIVISGPSGTGKGTICKEVLKRNDFWLSVSATTRSPRKGEQHGKEYYFLTKEEFEAKIEERDFLEYAHVYNNYYGTPKSNVIEKLEKGKDVILEIDIQGAINVKKAYSEAILIFILPPSYEELKNRIVNRGTETEESLKTRLESANREIECSKEYDYVVVNDTVDAAVRRVESIILAEKCKLKKMQSLIYDKFLIKNQ